MAAGGASQEPTRRSLLVDECAFEEQFLRCPICREKFDHTEQQPKSLPCNHTFCLPCLKHIFDAHQQGRRRAFAWTDDTLEGVLKCPTCRVEIFICRREISALPNDHRVTQMMDFLSQAVTKAQNVCQKHEHQLLNFFCKTCLAPVCRDCTVLDHKEQQGHEIVDMSSVITDLSNEFDDIEKTGKECIEKLRHRSDCLANASKRLDLIERQVRNEIKDTFIEYRLLLERRQHGLTNGLSELITEQKSQINSRFVEVCTHGSELQKLRESFIQARSSNDVKLLFSAHKKLKGQHTQLSELANVNDDELFKSCHFTIEIEGQFLENMSGIGEVNLREDTSLKDPVPVHQLVFLDSERRPDYEYSGHEELPPSSCADLLESREDEEEEEHTDTGTTDEAEPDSLDTELLSSDSLAQRAAAVAAAERFVQNAEAALASANRVQQAASESRAPRRPQFYRVVRHQAPPRSPPQEYSSSRYTTSRREERHPQRREEN